jgi:hypothetical protein
MKKDLASSRKHKEKKDVGGKRKKSKNGVASSSQLPVPVVDSNVSDDSSANENVTLNKTVI